MGYAWTGIWTGQLVSVGKLGRNERWILKVVKPAHQTSYNFTEDVGEQGPPKDLVQTLAKCEFDLETHVSQEAPGVS